MIGATLLEGLEFAGRIMFPFAGIGEFLCLNGEISGSVRGEIELATTAGSSLLSLSRLSITSAGLAAGEGGTHTGHLGVRHLKGEGEVTLIEDKSWRLLVPFEGLLTYDALARMIGRQHVPPDRYMAPVQRLEGLLEGVLQETSESTERRLIFTGEIRFRCPFAGARHWVRTFRMSMQNSSAWLFSVRVDFDEAPLGFRRRLKLKPVRLLDRKNDPAPTGDPATAKVQFDTAIEVWKKCCIDLEVVTAERRVEPNLKASDDPELVAESWDDPDKDTVEVFFVDNPLADNAGGATISCGWNTAKVVLADRKINPCILAHELGHVFAGVHPNPTDPPTTFFWEGDLGTVLEGILHPSDPIPKLNTLSNCTHAHNPALESLTNLPCRFTPDRFTPSDD